MGIGLIPFVGIQCVFQRRFYSGILIVRFLLCVRSRLVGGYCMGIDLIRFMGIQITAQHPCNLCMIVQGFRCLGQCNGRSIVPAIRPLYPLDLLPQQGKQGLQLVLYSPNLPQSDFLIRYTAIWMGQHLCRRMRIQLGHTGLGSIQLLQLLFHLIQHPVNDIGVIVQILNIRRIVFPVHPLGQSQMVMFAVPHGSFSSFFTIISPLKAPALYFS